MVWQGSQSRPSNIYPSRPPGIRALAGLQVSQHSLSLHAHLPHLSHSLNKLIPTNSLTGHYTCLHQVEILSFRMVHYPQPCDSYFVESHDGRERRFRDEMREHDRQAKRQTQVALAEQLSNIASHEYRDDHLRHMEQMEVRHLQPSETHIRC